MPKLTFSVAGGEPFTMDVNRVFNAGYAGRNQESVRAHIAELAELGVPAPSTTPTLYPVSNFLAVNETTIQVQNEQSSGEMEYVLIFHGGKTYLTIGSDQSDRELEALNVPKAKQCAPDVMAAEVWDLDEVADHFESIKTRCVVTKDGVDTLYMEGTLGDLLAPGEWTETFEKFGIAQDGNIFFSGCWVTIPEGFIYADSYRCTMTDDVLGRTIELAYDVEFLPRGVE
ncbi:MAG: DUF2848 family protein [Ancrocorticia sp.]